MEFSHAPGEVQGGLSLQAASNLTKREFVDMLHVAFMAEGPGFEARQILGDDGHKKLLESPTQPLRAR
ncbi:hypothetical protein V8E54_009701 [Elaphomyces granulatus]|jgi:hypothetical protein